ncbi:MAG: thioredoxin domain-containing protein [Trueperaceae bacterium]|nr:thioredoxin domain-containing protein [Trueperaceae bacterium]
MTAHRTAPRSWLTASSLILCFWLLMSGVAFAALGNAPGQLLSQLAPYSPQESEAGYVAADGFEFDLEVSGGAVVAVSGKAELTEANLTFLGALVGAASGYGEGIAAPVADFFRARAGELIGGGILPIQVLEYDLRAGVEAAAPGRGPVLSFRFEPQVVDDVVFPSAAHAIGPADAPYVVRVFSDFQCPFCRQFVLEVQPNIEALLLSRGDVRLEFHHFPLNSIHPNATPAAEAAECAAHVAGEEGFWKFHDLLFERQPTWSRVIDPSAAFAGIAETAGIDAAAFGACLGSGQFADLVETAYRAAGEALMLTGTPTVFLNGLKLGDYSSLGEYARLMRLSDAIQAAEDASGE